MAIEFQECDAGVRLRLRIRPRASRSELAGEHDGALVVRLTSAPVDGAANRDLIELLARTLGVPRSAVTIVSGETSRNKVVEIAGVSIDDVANRILP